MENEEIMMNETETTVEAPVTEPEVTEEESDSSKGAALMIAVGAAAIYGVYSFGKKYAVPTVKKGVGALKGLLAKKQDPEKDEVIEAESEETSEE